MKPRRKSLWPFTVALAMAFGFASAAVAEEYQFIRTPGWDPVATAIAGTSTATTVGGALDAVFNSVRATPGGPLTSKVGATILFIR